jgi:hypothetical protein
MMVNPEVYIEPTVNNIAGALGFSVDPTYFKKKVNLYVESKYYQLGDEAVLKRYDSIVEDIDKVFPAKMYYTRSVFTKKKLHRDSEGRLYLVMNHVSLERKSDKNLM